MENLVTYVSQFDPKFRERIRGASLEEINTLRQLSSGRLPKSYEHFLKYMGKDDGGLNIAFDGTTCINKIISYYQKYIVPGKEEIPDEFILIGIGSPPGEDVLLEGVSMVEPQVFFTGEGTPLTLYAESLEKLLFRVAFATIRMNNFSYEVFYTSTTLSRQREAAEALAISIGFQRHWFSDKIEFCGEMQSCAILINQYPEHTMAIRITGESKDELEHIGRFFAERFGMEQ